MLNILLPFLPKIAEVLLKNFDPQQKVEAQKLLAELEIKAREAEAKEQAARAEEFARFVEATQPKAEYVPQWINGLQAATRPLLTWIVMGSIVASFFVPGLSQNVARTLEAFGRAGTAGLLFLAIPAWWFFGRSMEKLIPGVQFLANGNGNGHGAPAKPVVSPTTPAGPKPAWPPPLPPVPGDNRPGFGG